MKPFDILTFLLAVEMQYCCVHTLRYHTVTLYAMYSTVVLKFRRPNFNVHFG